jgi:hypothetical protein
VTKTPRKGSAAEAALAYLTANGRTSHADLASAIDADPATLAASLSLCVSHGLIVRDAGDGVQFYDVPREEPIPAGEASEPLVIPAFLEDAIRVSRMPTQPKPPEETVRKVEFGMFSDGRLVLEFDDATYTLTAADKKRLFDFVFLFEVAK